MIRKMKRLLFFVFLIMMLALSTSAQTQTLVSGTLVDPNGIAYYPASVTACLSPATLNPTVGGRAVNPNPGANYCVGPTTTSVTGFFSLALWPNANISPAATTWVFSVAASGSGPPAGNGPLNFQSASVTISGATQDVSSNINSVGTAQLKAGSGGVGSGAAPIFGWYFGSNCPVANTGLCFFTPANTQQAATCAYTVSTTTVTCTTRLLSASGSVTSNVVTYTFPANVLPSWAIGNSITVTGFGVSDSFFNQTCTLTAVSTNSVTCPLTHANASSTSLGIVTNTSAGPFVSTDAGKRIWGYNTCAADSNIFNASNNQPMVTTPTTIATFNSSLSVSISQNAGFTPTNGATSTACVIWGNPDDSGATAFEAAYLPASNCPRVHLVNSNYMFLIPHFYNQPRACFDLPGIYATTPLGNLVYAEGFELDGRGIGTTVWWLPPGFPESGSCNNGTIKLACFVVPLEAKFSNFMISGGGNYLASNLTNNNIILEVDGPATLENFTGVNFSASNAATVYGVGVWGWGQINFFNLSGFGRVSFITGGSSGQSGSSVTVMRASIENPGIGGQAYNIGGLATLGVSGSYGQNVSQFNRWNFICYDCYAFSQLPTGAIALMRVEQGFSVKLYNYRASKYFGGLGQNGMVGLQFVNSGSGQKIADIEDSFLDMTAGGTSTSTGDIGINDQVGYQTYIKNSIIKGTSGGNTYSSNQATAQLFDGGANTWGTSPGASTSGSIVGEANSANIVNVTAGKLVLSAGWGTTAAVSALSGGNSPIQFTITNNGTGQGASPTVTYTFPTPYMVAPFSCTATQTGGTNASLNPFATSALSATGVTFTATGTPTASSTEIIQVTCVTP